MKCPYCGQEMTHGNLTGSSILRLMPEPETPKPIYHHNRNLPRSQYDTGLDGILLDVPYSGMAMWIPADFCQTCKKVIFDADVLHP